MKVLVIGSVYPRFHEDAEVPWLRTSVAHLRKAGVVPCDLGLELAHAGEYGRHVLPGLLELGDLLADLVTVSS